MCEQGKNDAERWFERYLREHGYEYDYEPDLGVSTRPDFLIRRDGVEVVCEVKGFEQPPRLERRLRGTTHATMVSDDEVYGPMRSAVREAALQLKPLAGSQWSLVVVLANPMGFYVHLSLDRLLEAMFGNPGFVASTTSSGLQSGRRIARLAIPETGIKPLRRRRRQTTRGAHLRPARTLQRATLTLSSF